MEGETFVGGQQRLQSVLNLLPLPALLVEPGSGRLLSNNDAARREPFDLSLSRPCGEDHRPYRVFGTDGQVVAPDEMPLRRAARGEVLEGVQLTWSSGNQQSAYLVFSGTTTALEGYPATTLVTFVDVTKLRATEVELRAAVDARDNVLSIATHELKDPLAALQLSLDLIRLMARKEPSISSSILLERLQVAKRQADRLARLIENLLDLSRISNHRIQLDVAEFDLCDVVDDVLQAFQEQAQAAGLSLSPLKCEPAIGCWDRAKIDQVANNLISNALKYGSGKPVTVRVYSDPNTAFLEVKDQGIGIAQEDQARVFDSFERASSAAQNKSLGLGLYIVKSLVEAHGGRVRLESALGQGSTFTVELPRSQPAAEARELISRMLNPKQGFMADDNGKQP